ncbi:unnamed protein product, partial [Timema podura]|nr:unnamed protein product [Timema podura]
MGNYCHSSQSAVITALQVATSREKRENVPIVLVGNKTDLHMERMISSEEGKRLAELWKAAFLETSAKQNE